MLVMMMPCKNSACQLNAGRYQLDCFEDGNEFGFMMNDKDDNDNDYRKDNVDATCSVKGKK